ncbi:MAG: transcriptional regulator [Rhodospirillaceae bacterium]|nr:MAG: transcriptional regulator [Rhodospirillaceae bacterium]
MKKSISRDSAQAAWGKRLPDWVLVLAEECDRTSQSRAAIRIGYTAGTINAVLKHSYKGDLGAVEQAARGSLMGATVECPVDGEITTDKCIANQRQKFTATSNRRIRLWRACRGGCTHSRIPGE